MNTSLPNDAVIYDELFAKAPQSIIIIDDTGSIIRANVPASRLLRKIGHGDDTELNFLSGITDAVSEANGNGDWMQFRSIIDRVEGACLDCKIRRLRTVSDRFFYAVTLQQSSISRNAFRDLSKEIARVEKERAQLYADKLKHEFISVVSHELRTPLTSILGALGLARSGNLGTLPEKISQLLEMAHANGERLLDLINDILDFEKFQSGNFDFSYADASVRDLLDAAMTNATGLAIDKNITLEARYPETDASVCIDARRFAQIMANLLSNAIKFSGIGSTVTVTFDRMGDDVKISVIDQGPGIDERFRPQIFEKFTQAGDSATRAHGGTGLGLSITQRIVREFGGEISFTCERGTGTEFFFTVPVAENATRSKTTQSLAATSAERATVR